MTPEATNRVKFVVFLVAKGRFHAVWLHRQTHQRHDGRAGIVLLSPEAVAHISAGNCRLAASNRTRRLNSSHTDQVLPLAVHMLHAIATTLAEQQTVLCRSIWERHTIWPLQRLPELPQHRAKLRGTSDQHAVCLLLLYASHIQHKSFVLIVLRRPTACRALMPERCMLTAHTSCRSVSSVLQLWPCNTAAPSLS